MKLLSISILRLSVAMVSISALVGAARADVIMDWNAKADAVRLDFDGRQ